MKRDKDLFPDECRCGAKGRTVDSRRSTTPQRGKTKRRRKKCPACGKTWTTYEHPLPDR